MIKFNPLVSGCVALLLLGVSSGWSGEPVTAALRSDSAVPSASPTRKDAFVVHSRYALVLAAKDLALDQQVRDFPALFKLIAQDPKRVGTWSREMTADEAQQPNFLSFGFSGNTGYYKDPQATGPSTRENTTPRDIDFKVTYHDVKDDTVQVNIAVNDTRDTPQARDNEFVVTATVVRDRFQLIRLGPPQLDRQGWLALLVDRFDLPVSKMPVPEMTLPADHKVDLQFTSTDGQAVDTSKMRGKVILVDFWATWCGPCVESLPIVAQLQEKYHDRGFEVIGVSLDTSRTALDKFLKKSPHPWPQAFFGPGANPLAERFGINGIPAFLLIDKTGTATVIDVRNPDTDEIIAAQLDS